MAVAFALAAWRDHGAGLLPDRPGRTAASGLLRGPFGLAWRLQGGVLLGWMAAYLFTFAAFGAAAKGVGEILGTSAVLKQYFLRLGYQHTIIDAYLSALMLLARLALAALLRIALRVVLLLLLALRVLLLVRHVDALQFREYPLRTQQ